MTLSVNSAPSYYCGCGDKLRPHPRMHVARGVPCAKVFSAKSSFTPIRESFLPRKIPAIRYIDGPTTITLRIMCTRVNKIIRESVDSLCRDGADTPMVRVHRKAFLTCERSCSKPFWAPSYSIPVVVYPKIPPK